MQTKSNKFQKFFALFSLFLGVSVFGFVIALTEGWTPFPSASASTIHEVAVIPVDAPTNIEVDGELAAPKPIQIAEVTIVVQQPKRAKPGAARRMPSPMVENVSESGPRKLVSPTGLASEEALSYQPSFGHGVRGPQLEMRASAFSHPVRSTEREHETFVFDGN